nr:(2Fe-2S)-binding protein [Streptomyces sp. SID161]
MPEAIATIGHLYRRGLPVPSDRPGLLLGIQPQPGPAAADPADAVVCLCNHVSRRQLADAWELGARTAPELARATRATTGCGSCVTRVERLCADLADAAERKLEPTP